MPKKIKMTETVSSVWGPFCKDKEYVVSDGFAAEMLGVGFAVEIPTVKPDSVKVESEEDKPAKKTKEKNDSK